MDGINNDDYFGIMKYVPSSR